MSIQQTYRQWGKIYWAKLSHFSWFSGVLRKFFHEYKHFSLIVLNNVHLWPRQHESISMKILMALQLWMFNPANLSPSKVRIQNLENNYPWTYKIDSSCCLLRTVYCLLFAVKFLPSILKKVLWLPAFTVFKCKSSPENFCDCKVICIKR